MEAFEVDDLPFHIEEELVSEVAVLGAVAAVQLQVVSRIQVLAPSFSPG